jgi:predicted DNA-binding transcriptional regulator AlpA
MDETFLTSKELAARWKVSVGKLYMMRLKAEGVQPVRIGGSVRYLLSDIENYENTLSGKQDNV